MTLSSRTYLPAALLLATLCGASSSAHAQTLGFDVIGEVYRKTCSFTASDVPLGQHEARTFTGVGSGTPWRLFNIITVSSCSAAVTGVRLTYTGTPDPDDPAKFGFTGFSGVALDLATAAGGRPNVAIPPGRTIAHVRIADGTVYQHAARLVQTSPTIVPGIGSAPIVVSISYP
ncbi:fimbrial protein [Stenotrophomonas rhizophila]|uniref:Type 1 fimbria pilin n=1 Tax=Stenotrophomonas rhizophila TaxID=216778 RepID=A0AAW5PK68_9GAMM|nr:hypothetical protein [Stenotrophomonas rhizophila]MCS4280143.1 type 1 fimbria pilin [Stenotrophomonas rhizophila]